MPNLSNHARHEIRARGISVAAYIRHHTGSTTWHGDICGCTDDRCADGYHHEGIDDCRCLPVLLNMMEGH
jgi:hypothetical protein